MDKNIFEIRYVKYGVEEFEMIEPEYNLHKTDDGSWEFIVCFEKAKVIKRVKELEEVIDAEIHFEVTAVISADDLELKVGKVITQKEGYDYKRDINLSNIYYFEHEPVENLRIELVEVSQNYIIINLIAETVISDYRSGKPDAKLYIEKGKFNLNKKRIRGVC